MKKAVSNIGVFILALNEQANIGRCLGALQDSNWDLTVLDSGSTDNTATIVREFSNVQFRQYKYTDHCAAYNEITTSLGSTHRFVVILDADMELSKVLQQEIEALLSTHGAACQVIKANIDMYIEGMRLKFGSLCPPKPLVFAVGREYCVRRGHGETLHPEVKVLRTRENLRHDDRKSYATFLLSQIRYARQLAKRRASGELSFRDRVRLGTPFLVFAVPFVSFFLKRGFLSGKAGAIYALDRLIAEAVMYRQALLGGLSDD